ncbi:MAG: DinB family protein, partial [Acidobacteriota bacterium]
MQFGYLADMVATIPTWIVMQLTQESLDVAPADGSKFPRTPKVTRADYLKALDDAAAQARQAFKGVTDEKLTTPWQLKARGNVVQEGPRYEMIQETLSHWSHHRGQMTVYLRLMGAKVPALFGPSADENSFK